jgi:hypothetical protein
MPALRPGASRRCMALALSLACVFACAENQGAMPPAAVASECVSDSSSRWVGPWSRTPTFIGDLGTNGAAGIAVSESTLFVYQRDLGEVWQLDQAGGRLEVFGREGQGPGEFARGGATRVHSHGRVSWLDMAGDTVIVFDGDDVQLFTKAGTYLNRVRAVDDVLKGFLFFSKRIQSAPGGILIDIEQRRGASRDLRPRVRPYTLWLLTDPHPRAVLTIELPPLPTDKRGAQHQSVREAQPMWAMAGACVVVSDGSSPWLLVSSIAGTGPDTVRFPLPDRMVSQTDEEAALLKKVGAERDRLIPPSLPLAVRDLSIDPSGWVWILPIQPERGVIAGVEVVRVPIGVGDAVFDTVPAFPIAFGSDGEFYGITLDGAGDRRLARFAHGDHPAERPM